MVALWGDRGPRGHVASLVTQQPQRSEAKVVQPVTQARPRPGATCHPPLALGCALWPAGSLLVPRPPSHVPLSHFRFLSVQRALYTWPHRLLQAKTGSSDEHGVPGSCVRMRIRVLSPLLDLECLRAACSGSRSREHSSLSARTRIQGSDAPGRKGE